MKTTREKSVEAAEELEESSEVVVMKLPAWLQSLMSETFFEACGAHQNRRKNEKNIFCLNCIHSFCTHCMPSHQPSHALLQVRRYVYHNVIRLDELEKLIDCCYIQPYTNNGAKVIFLNQRAQSTSCNNKGSSGNSCLTCDRILQEPFNFCSLSCKVDHMVYTGEDVSSILYGSTSFDDESDFPISQFEGLRVDFDTATRSAAANTDHDQEDYDEFYHGFTMMMGNNNDDYDHNHNNSADESHEDQAVVINSRRKGGRFNFHNMRSLSSRRKGAPHRSPLS